MTKAELKLNKRGREDCADCPFPERYCGECINGKRRPVKLSKHGKGEQNDE